MQHNSAYVTEGWTYDKWNIHVPASDILMKITRHFSLIDNELFIAN